MPPNKRPLISKYPGGNVAAGTSATNPVGADPLGANRSFRITCFGAALTHVGTAELQIRTQLTPTEKWRTLRMVVGPGSAHFENFQPIEGDGVVALRIVRTNDDATDRKIKVWCEGFRR